MTASTRKTVSARLAIATLLTATLVAPVAAAPTKPLSDDVARLAARADSNLRAAELRPTDEKALVFYRKAADLAAKALADDTNSARAHFLYFAAQGRLLVAEGPLRNAVQLKALKKHLDIALQLDPNYSDALAAKGAILMELPGALGGDRQQGEELLRRAVEEYPVGPTTRLLFAKALITNGDLTAARRELDLASYYACRQWRYRALRDAQELLHKVERELGSGNG